MKILNKLGIIAALFIGSALAQSGTANVVGTATSTGVTASSTVTLTVISPPVTLSCSAPVATGIGPVIFSGLSLPCTATLNAAAPTGGTVVTLAGAVNVTGGTVVLTVPPSVTVPAGATSATFNIAAK